MARILIVENSPTFRRGQEMLVEGQHGWQALTAENGCEAIEVIQREPIDVVVTDIRMPEINGLELIDAASNSFPDLPVILVPAHTQGWETIDAMRRGAVSYTSEKELHADFMDAIGLVVDLADADDPENDLKLGGNTQFLVSNDRESLIAAAKSIANLACEKKLGTNRRRIQLAAALYYLCSDAVQFGHFELEPALRSDRPKEFQDEAAIRRSRHPYATRQLVIDVTRDSTSGIHVCLQHGGRTFDAAVDEDFDTLADPPMAHTRAMLMAKTLLEDVQYDAGNRRFTFNVPVSVDVVTNR